MSTKNYDQCLARVLEHEGGYTNDPRDPGGPTNFGITIFDYRKYVKPGATAVDVRAMSLVDAKKIYRDKYWDALRCDDLPPGVDDSVFDYGVNSGIGRSGKILRAVLGLPANDWHVTPAVLAEAAKHSPAAIVVGIDDERLHFLHSLHTWPAFGVGWGRRVAEVKAFSLALANGNQPNINPQDHNPAPGKAPHSLRDLQAAMNKLHVLDHNILVDNQWGPQTKLALETFQEHNPPLVVDGIPGVATWDVVQQQLEKAAA